MQRMDSGHFIDGVSEKGYDGTREPVRIEDVDHSNAAAVVVGSLVSDGHLIRAEGVGIIVVQNIPVAERKR